VSFTPSYLKCMIHCVARFIVVGGDAPLVANKASFLELEHLTPPGRRKVPLQLEAWSLLGLQMFNS
jgi:hypothetical protein